jgi:sigma-B regulation protein RsbU (phosphoserine phosphatase)
MDKTYEQLLEDNRRLAEENERLKNEYEKLGEMYDDLSLSYEDALMMYDKAKESIRMESELEVASNIQMSMIPKKFPEIPNIDLYASVSPAKEVGGDLYDFFQKDDILFFCIGDVSGKGIPASLLMTVTTSQFRTVSRYMSQPDQIVMAINNQMAEGNDTHMFVTLFVGCLDLKTGHLAYCCGGHNPPLLIDTDVKRLPISFKLPVGAIKGMKYVLQETQITPGTTLFLYTDGLTEAMDADMNMFGNDRMNETIQDLLMEGENTPKAIIDRLTDDVRAFVKGAPQSDDLTMMAIKYKS